MDVIHKWLSGSRNFFVGRSIYNAIGTDDAVKQLLAKGPTEFAKQTLEKSLRQIIQERDMKPLARIIEPADSSTNKVLSALKSKADTAYQRMNMLRHELHRFGTDNTPESIAYRQSLAFEILDLHDKCESIWKEKEHYNKHGELPGMKPEKEIDIPTDPIKLAGLIQNIKRNIRRNQQLSVKHPDNVNYAIKYKHYLQLHVKVTGEPYNEKSDE